MGGSSQSWDETALAHRILSNPDSRKLYDETGEEAEAHSECNLTHQAFAIIGTLLQNLLARKIDICAINLPQEMVAILYDQRRPPARQVEDFTRIEKAATEAARRVKRCSSEDNFLERMLLSQAQQARRILEKAIEHVDAINHAIELLEDCSFEVGG
jgi:curved DNA-binding protein CbpA